TGLHLVDDHGLGHADRDDPRLIGVSIAARAGSRSNRARAVAGAGRTTLTPRTGETRAVVAGGRSRDQVLHWSGGRRRRRYLVRNGVDGRLQRFARRLRTPRL